MRRIWLGRLALSLLGAATFAFCHAQPQPPTTEAQARYYVYGAFLTHAVPEILGERFALGAELEQRLGIAPGADRKSIYDALMSYTDKRPLSVRKATLEEIARYKPQAKRDLKDPLFTVQAGDVMLLVEYDLQQNTIPFVGQIGVAYQPPRPPVAAPRAAPKPPVATVAPRLAPVTPPPARPQEVLKPNGPCVVQPVMSEQDLANCRGAPAARIQPLPPSVVKPPPAARVAPPPAPATPQRTGQCEVKPVMSEEDLANCRAAPGGAARIQPGPPAVVKPQARTEPAPEPRRTAPCEVKPVMTEEDLANCRNAPGGAARVQPGPPIVVKPQAAVKPEAVPQRAVLCEVKPVMTEEELAACRNAPGGAARVDAGVPPAPRPATAAPAPKPAAAPCLVKPVMSEEDLIACGIRR